LGSVIPGVGTAVGAGVGAGVGAIVGIGKALFSYNAMKKQEGEDRRVEAANLALLGEAKAERRENTAWERHFRERSRKDQLELNKYNKVMNFMDGLNNQFRLKPQIGTNLVNMWNARR